MLRMCRLVFVCWFSLVTFINADEYDVGDDKIDLDYYFGTAVLRTEHKPELCRRNLPPFICNLPCFENHICVDGQCRCLDRETMDVLPKESSDPIEYSLQLPRRPTRTRPIKEDTPRPALRHHIAHFCPNLDDARVCIRKCMKTGKPAFCGKDHECYCGHKYEDPVEDQEADAEAIYAGFKDMYEKYFGKNYRPK